MHDPRRAGWTWAGLGLAVVLSLVAVAVATQLSKGEDSSEVTPNRVPVQPADYLGYDSYPSGGSLDLPSDVAYLTGPNFTVAFDTLEISAFSGFDFHAADGYEFLRLTPRPTLAGAPTEPVTAQVVVDGTPRPVDLTRIVQSGLIVSVPTGHTATLQVTDEGRTQTLDLRTGLRGQDAIAGYYPQQVLSWQNADYNGSGESSVDGCHRETTFQLGFSPNSTAVLPWGPVVGWAQPGRAWLPIAYTGFIEPVSLPPDFADFASPSCGIDPNIEWDLGGSVGVQTAAGEAAPTRIFPDSSGTGGTMVFDVPLSLPSATLVVHPAATYQESGRQGPVRWTTPPPTARTEMVAE